MFRLTMALLAVAVISTILASIFLATVDQDDSVRYFYIAWLSISAALLWLILCTLSILFFRGHWQAVFQEEPRVQCGKVFTNTDADYR